MARQPKDMSARERKGALDTYDARESRAEKRESPSRSHKKRETRLVAKDEVVSTTQKEHAKWLLMRKGEAPRRRSKSSREQFEATW